MHLNNLAVYVGTSPNLFITRGCSVTNMRQAIVIIRKTMLPCFVKKTTCVCLSWGNISGGYLATNMRQEMMKNEAFLAISNLCLFMLCR